MNWLRETLSAPSGMLSSKRICGTLGFLICLGILIYCTILEIQAPDMVDTLLCCMGLLGVDSVTSIWKPNNGMAKQSNLGNS